MITYIASTIGRASNISVVENFAPLIIAKILIKNPYIDFPLEPDIILGGGKAKNINESKDPVIKIDIVLENREKVLTPMIKINRIIIIVYDSTNPGSPPTHLTELIQSKIQSIKSKSPGNIKEIGKDNMFVLNEDICKSNISLEKILILTKSITENAIIPAAKT